MAKNQPGPQKRFSHKTPFRKASGDLVLVIQLFGKRESQLPPEKKCRTGTFLSLRGAHFLHRGGENAG